MEPGARGRRRPRRRGGGRSAAPEERQRRRRGRRLAPRVPRGARTCATRWSRCGVLSRHLRDRDHLGPLRRVPRDRARDARREAGAGARRGAMVLLPLHPRLPRRPGALLHVLAPARRGSEVEQWDEIKAAVSEVADRRRRHDHPPPRRRPRPPALVRPPAARRVRRGARAAKRALDPAGDPQPGRPDRPRGPNLPPAMPPLVRALRPQEWIKNLLVFAGVLFSRRLDEAAALADALLTFAAFCAISSAGYLFNDLRDREHDRRHPDKRHRPIASGARRAGDRGRGRASSSPPGAIALALGFAVDAEVAGARRALRGDHRRLLAGPQAAGDPRRDDDRLAVHPPGRRRRGRRRRPRRRSSC